MTTQESTEQSQNTDDTLAFVLGGPARYTRPEIVERAGMDDERGRKLWQAMGFAQVEDADRAFTDTDLQALKVAKELGENGVDDQLMLVLARSMGQTLSRLADSHVSAYLERWTESGGEEDLADAPLVGQVEFLLPRLDWLIGFVWRRQLAGSLEQLLPHAGNDERPLSVGFVDLAGFTKLSRQLSRQELLALTENFEREASGVIADLGGRLVKTIGDEVMFYAGEPGDAVEIALRLIDALGTIEDMPQVHAGVATGPVLLRLGDVYGATVNIAARLTSIARKNSLVVDKATADALEGAKGLRIRQTRGRRVSGYKHLVPYAVRRSSEREPG